MTQPLHSRRWTILVLLLVLFTLARIVMTHRVFAQTQDENWHLISGYDVLTKWDFRADLHHPPLARVLFALPFVSEPDPVADGSQARGNLLLLRNERYTQNLARMRMGNLPFVALAIVVVALWARRLLSPAAGLFAALVFASTPQILAHGGLATTDMASVATLALAWYALTLVLEKPTWRRSGLLALAITLGALAKFSFLPYFPVGAALLMLIHRRVPLLRLAAATVAALLVCWAVYRCDIGSIQQYDARAESHAVLTGLPVRLVHVPLPAPAYFAGVLEVQKQNSEGQKGFLFGEVRQTGWWYYFPLALFFKTPLPLLLLFAAGCVILVRQKRGLEAVALAFGILAVAMTSHINIGVRHVLPIYVPMAVVAGAVVTQLRLRLASAALALWLVTGIALAHPDYLPWFNRFAGSEPHQILNDSNLDWGQDVLRLVRYARRENIPQITTALAGAAPLDRIGLPQQKPLIAFEPLHGHIAVSELTLALGRDYSPEVGAWIHRNFDARPYTRVGTSIRVYSFD
jgi:hypothetical protein